MHARLLRVSGNNQQAQAGEVLPEPLVVRLEDQFHNPIVGEQVAGRDPRGNARFIQTGSNTAAMVTDAEGKASFSVEVSPGKPDDVMVRVAAGEQAVQFFIIVGAVDTPDAPLDVAVTGNIVDWEHRVYRRRRSGPRIVDVSNPKQPRTLQWTRGHCHPMDLRCGGLDGNRLYVAIEPLPPLRARHHSA